MVGLERQDAAGTSVEQRSHRHRFRRPPVQFSYQVREAQPGVHDILHQHDLAPGHVAVQILDQSDPSGISGEPGQRQEVHLHRYAHRSDQIGQKRQASLQYRHQHNPIGVVLGNLRSHPPYGLLYGLRACEQLGRLTAHAANDSECGRPGRIGAARAATPNRD